MLSSYLKRGLPKWAESFRWRRATSPSAVLIAANAGSILLRLASTIVLTRLLAPDDFGTVAIIASIFSIITLITDAGFQAFVVRHERGDDPEFLDTIWTIHFLRGLMNALIAAALAVPLAHLLQKPTLNPLLMVASALIAVDGAASLSLLTALRRNLVRRLSMIDLAAQFAQLVVGVLAAWLLRNAWALVIAMILSSIVRTAGSYLAFPDARRHFLLDRRVVKELWRFSRVIAISSMLTLAISQFDKVVLARFLTLQQFGIYAIAANLAAAPIAVAAQYSSRIFYPAMATTWRKDRERIVAVYYELRGLLFYAYLLCGGLLIGSAPLVIRVLYDPRYLQAGFYLRLLAISTSMAIVTYNSNNAFIAIGRLRETMSTNIIRMAWLLPVGLLGFLTFGPTGLVTTIALIELPAYLYMSWRLRKLGLFDFRLELIPWLVVSSGAVVGSVCSGLVHVFLFSR